MSDPVGIAALFPGQTAKIARLRRAHILTSEDLLRRSRSELSRATGGALTVPELLLAQQTASLIEVAGMSLEMAQALVSGGISGVRELVLRDLNAVQALLPATSPRDVAELLKDAVLVANTGVLDGVVVSPQGKPLAKVTVVSGTLARTTDRYGRFRLQRLRARPAVHVTLQKKGHAPLEQDVRSVVLPEVVQQLRFVLPKGKAPARRAVSEFNGDTLPRYDGTRIKIAPQLVSRIPVGEVVRHQGGMANGRVRLSSRFLRWQDGEFQALQYRVAGAQVPAEATSGTDLLSLADGLKVVKLSRTGLSILRAARRVRKQGRPPRDLKQATQQLNQLLGRLRQAGAIGKRKRGGPHG
jgi:Domain of unknown function (DUF4332)